MSRYGFGSNVHTLGGTIGSPGGSSRRTTRSTTTFDDIQTQIIRGNQVRITIDDPNMTHPINGNTLLHEAIQAQNIHFVNYLIENGADPNILNKYGENAYTIAYRVNNQSIIKKIKFIGDKTFKDRKLRSVIISEENKFWKFISNKKYLMMISLNIMFEPVYSQNLF